MVYPHVGRVCKLSLPVSKVDDLPAQVLALQSVLPNLEELHLRGNGISSLSDPAAPAAESVASGQEPALSPSANSVNRSPTTFTAESSSDSMPPCSIPDRLPAASTRQQTCCCSEGPSTSKANGEGSANATRFARLQVGKLRNVQHSHGPPSTVHASNGTIHQGRPGPKCT